MSSFKRKYRRRRYKRPSNSLVMKEMKKQLNLVKPEKKIYQSSIGSLVSDTTGDILYIPAIAQGDATGERIGNSVRMYGFSYRVVVSANTGGSSNDQQNVRIMLVQDNDPVGGAVPTVVEILDTATLGSLPLVSNADRFKILHDRICAVSKASVDNKRVNWCTGSYNYKGLYQKFTGASNSTQIKRNHYLVIFGDMATANAPTSTGAVRLEYTDA